MKRLDQGAPLACTLNDEDFRERRQLARRTLLKQVIRSVRTEDGLIVALVGGAKLRQDLETFITLERECCSFLDFAVQDGAPIELTISGPPEAARTIDMFAEAIGSPAR